MADFELIENIPFTTQQVVGNRARIGLIVLASDYTIEHEFRSVFDLAGVDVFHARINNAPNITPETLADMGPTITETAQRLLPDDTLDVLAYGCTSASMVLGPDEIAKRLKQAKPEAKTSNPVSAAVAAMNALDAKRIAVLTPYRSDVNEILRDGFLKQGWEVPIFGSFNEEMDPVVAQIDDDSLFNAVDHLATRGDVDAIFVSCTSIRMMHLVHNMEAKTGLPVTSSNHAMAWHCMRQAGIEEALPGRGKLFTLPLSSEMT